MKTLRGFSTGLLMIVAAVAALLGSASPARAQDILIARRAPVFCTDTTRPYAFYQPIADSTHSVPGWYCTATEPVVYNGSSLTATATELNKNAGVTAGTAAASKTLVLGANKNVDTIAIAASGLKIGAGAGTAVTATAAELNVNAGVTGGTVTASKTVVVDANKHIDVLGLPTSGLKIGVSGSETVVSATGAEINTAAGVTAGTVAASKHLVVDANKAVDTLRTTTDRTLGGTGVAGGALVQYETVKEVTAIADATATTILTVSVPNAAHAAMLEFDIVGRLGAGGAIGADEAVSSSKYQMTCARTAGVASVCTLSSQLGAVNVAVAGAATVTATLTAVANGEGVGATNTHSIKITITKSGGSSANHKADVHVRLHNANATGITVS